MRAFVISIALTVFLSATAAQAQCPPGKVPVVVPSGKIVCQPAPSPAVDHNPHLATATPTRTATRTATVSPTATSTNIPTATVTLTNTATNTPNDTLTPSPTRTPTPCPNGGTAVGGFCWYLGAPAASCDATCGAVGAICDLATITYAGSGGTDAHCAGVLAAFGINDLFVSSAECPSGTGCGDSAPLSGRCSLPPTTCDATYPNFDRVCACEPASATNTPADTPTPTPTSATCSSGGTTVGGSCWYLGAPGESCDATCSAVGAVCDSPTITYAGSGGSDANCASVLAAFGVTDPFVSSVECPSGTGCGDSAPLSGRCSLPPTTCDASYPSFERACACQ
jgi:hypothetical protein